MTFGPYLSVVIPAHNVGLWIGECLESILGQTHQSLEIIVVDDHSTDDTVSIVSALAARDARISLIHAAGSGGANARNLGARIAGGKYLVFADGDDIVPKGGYAAMIASLEASGSDVAVGDFLKFSSTKTWHPSDSWRDYGTDAMGVTLAQAPSLIRHRACWNKVFRRDFWVRTNIAFPEVARSNDIVPMITALTKARRIDVVRDIVYLYRDRSGPTSMTARAGSSASLLSYFRQELECARALSLTNDPKIMLTYASLVLHADGWVHLDRWMSSLGDGDVMDPREEAVLAADVRELLSLIPAKGFNRLEVGRQLVFALVAGGRFDLARSVHADTVAPDVESSRLRVPKKTSAGTLDRWIEIGEAIADVISPLHTLGPKFIDTYLVDPFVRAVPKLTATELHRIPVRISKLVGNMPIELDTLGADSRIVLDQPDKGSVTDVAILSKLRYESVLRVEQVRTVGDRIVLSGTHRGLPKGAVVTFSAKRRGRPGSVVVGTLRPSGADRALRQWSQSISGRSISRTGVWDLEVQFSFATTTAAHVLSASDSIKPFSRDAFSPMFVRPIRFTGAPIVIERRAPFTRRVLSYGARRLPGVAKTARRVINRVR